jgi:hypothetical protein
MSTQKKEGAEQQLRDMGAVRELRQDGHGAKRWGWWLDGVYLGPADDPEYSLRVATGGG